MLKRATCWSGSHDTQILNLAQPLFALGHETYTDSPGQSISSSYENEGPEYDL